MNQSQGTLGLKLYQPHQIALLSRKVDNMYNNFLRIRRQVQQGDMKTIQALSDLKVEATQSLGTVEDYLANSSNQHSRAYLFSAETLLLNIIGNHQTSKINEHQSNVPWKKAPSKLPRKVSSSKETTESPGGTGSFHNLSKSSSKGLLSSQLHKQNSRRFLNSDNYSCRENTAEVSSRSLKKKQFLAKSPVKCAHNKMGPKQRVSKGEQDKNGALQSMLTVRLTEQDYRQVLRMKLELGIE